MKQYAQYIQNYNKNNNKINNNNNNKNKNKRKVKNSRRPFVGSAERERVERDFFYFFFSLFTSFSDLRKFDRRFSSGLKAKLIYVMRATRGHKKVGVSTNSMR